MLEFPINVRFGFVEVLRASCPESADPKMEIIYCTVKRINGSNESVVLCIYFVYLSCVIVYKMLFTRWLFTGLTNGRCKRFYDGELPPPTCDDGVFSSVEVMVATGDFLLRWYYL